MNTVCHDRGRVGGRIVFGGRWREAQGEVSGKLKEESRIRREGEVKAFFRF